MGNVKLYGATSGYTELAPPAVAPDGVLSLPSGTGTLATLADVAAGGKVLQVVTATTSTQVSSVSSTYVTTTLEATITPTSATSTILVSGMQTYFCSGGAFGQIKVRIMRGLTELEEWLTFAYFRPDSGSNLPILWSDSPATTSATTYKTEFARHSGTGTIYTQLGTPSSQIVLMEVAA